MIPPFFAPAPSTIVNASTSVSIMAKGISSKPIVIPCSAASAHSAANASISRAISHFSRKKSPTFTCLAFSASAAANSFSFSISDCFFLSPSRNQSFRNSSSTCFVPLSSRILFISFKLLVLRTCSRSACQIPTPLKPARAAAATRSSKSNGLYSLYVCGCAPPAIDQYEASSSTSCATLTSRNFLLLRLSSVRRRRPAAKKCSHRRWKLFRFFNRGDVPALLKADQLRARDSRGVPFSGSDWQQLVLFSPRHQRRHLDTGQLFVQSFGSKSWIPQQAPHRVAVVNRQLVRESPSQRLLIQPAGVVEDRLHQSAHPRQ